jgi:formylglycine-generating enzyme required for sulfatase activity
MNEGRVGTIKLLGVMLVWCAASSLCAAVHAEPPGEGFAQMVERLRNHPDDKALRERIVKAARELAPAPVPPEEARRFFIRGNTALEDAQSRDGYLRAIRNYDEALKIAPWWGDAYRNLAKARDLAKEYSGAIDALGFYLLSGPAAADARQAQDRIYALEEKQDEQQAPAQERHDAPAAGPERAGQEGLAKQSADVDARKPGAAIRDCADCPEMVVVDASYAIGKYLVTQRQWRNWMGSNPSLFQDCGDECPVEDVSWNDAQEFLARLNKKTGKVYALPTEAQWEAACHAGSQTEFCGSQQFEAVAWYLRNSGARTHPVGQKQPNGLGLYDMNGNVWEWTNDCSKGDCRYRILRGGSWSFDPQFPRASKRIGIEASYRLNDYGLRLVRALP